MQIICLIFCFLTSLYAAHCSQEKILICGVCKDVEQAVPNTIWNVERLGSLFAGYTVIIYENNSTDRTAALLRKWADTNPHVVFISETVAESDLPRSREERIARARNIVLAKAQDYADCKYLLMADLDFMHPWPVDRIIDTIESGDDWDCVSANGLDEKGDYYDRYAFRDETFPLGPELVNDWWWRDIRANRFSFVEGASMRRVYSAFGGLAIYHTKSILPFSYSGTVTEDLRAYYKEILINHPLSFLHTGWFRPFVKKWMNHHMARYLSKIKMKNPSQMDKVPIVFHHPLNRGPVCEHVALHAAMATHGFDKFYVNPNMVIRYAPPPTHSKEKILICGVCKDVEQAVPNTIWSMERLGSLFAGYTVIIYENNSTDRTVSLLQKWADTNPHVVFISETVAESDLPRSREERIARARNIVLAKARDLQYADFKYLVMADLDLMHPWPIDSILETIESGDDWDCVSANGVNERDRYYDHYAFRDERFPFGPELIGDCWWEDLGKNLLSFAENGPMRRVYSAFGGLAIYKTKSILPFSYSARLTDDLREYYKEILIHHPRSFLHVGWLRPFVKKWRNPHIASYLRRIKMKRAPQMEKVPIVFQDPLNRGPICEHVALHAAMATHGFGKFYVNPKMVVHNKPLLP
ncbi:MAG: hypothetical protein KGR16_04330 [Verrucomicrobia bacterium]|nr:hypothetical protein [Verrucomicrobiota bacterium]